MKKVPPTRTSALPSFFFAFAVALFPASNIKAQTETFDKLTRLVELIEKAGEIIASIANGIEEANTAGLRIYDTYSAREANKRLRKLMLRLYGLDLKQRPLVIDSIDRYLPEAGSLPDPKMWPQVQSSLAYVFQLVVGVEEDLTKETSNFLLEPEHQQLLEVIHARRVILKHLMSIDPPMTEAELIELEKVRNEYNNLIGKLKILGDSLREYLKRMNHE